MQIRKSAELLDWIFLGWIAVLSALPGCLLAEPPIPTPKALQRTENLRATHSGTDSAGNLWWWNRGSRLLQVLSPRGEVLLQEEMDGGFPTALTFDARWGAAVLDENRDLLLRPLRGESSGARIAREGEAIEVAWIGDGKLAVAPSRTRHRVEIWDAKERRLVGRWGDEEEISEGPGFHRVRTVLLAWDEQNDRLWTLETFTGELVVFSGRGDEVLRRTLVHPRLGKTLAWVKDKELQKLGGADEREDTHLNLWTSLSLAPDGAAWILEGCDRERGTVQFRRMTPAGDVEAREVDLGCCPAAVRSWGTESVPFHDPRLPRGQPCNGSG